MLEEKMVSDQETLGKVAGLLGRSSAVAVDTEFVRESTYFPQLCLLQVAADEVIACIDCLAPLDLEPLFDALFHSERVWIVHSSRQDLEVLWNRTQRLPARLNDTQIAASLLGFPPQIGLQDLLSAAVAVELEKGHTRTNWSRRPLPDAALAYALDDVRYLGAACIELERRLEALGRLEWFHEDSQRLLEESPVADPLTIFKRLRGVSKLPPAGQRAAYSLVCWREQRAMRADRPRRWIVSDELLMSLAHAMPADLDALRRVGNLPRRLVEHSGRDILDAIRDADRPEIAADVEAAQGSQLPDKGLLKSLQLAVKRRAEALGVQTEVLATRRDLAAIAAGQTPANLASGWRARVLEGLDLAAGA